MIPSLHGLQVTASAFGFRNVVLSRVPIVFACRQSHRYYLRCDWFQTRRGGATCSPFCLENYRLQHLLSSTLARNGEFACWSIALLAIFALRVCPASEQSPYCPACQLHVSVGFLSVCFCMHRKRHRREYIAFAPLTASESVHHCVVFLIMASTCMRLW